ncbi:hypothetical protein Tco_0156164 [Tanacetum coccineum]
MSTLKLGNSICPVPRIVRGGFHAEVGTSKVLAEVSKFGHGGSFSSVHRHEDGVTVTDENLFGALRNRYLERSANRWEQSFNVEILTFAGSLKPEEFIDWLSQADEIMDFKNVPDNHRNLRHGTRSIDEYTTDFYECLARLDLNKLLFQLVSHYIGGLRLQLQDVLNMFDPLTVGSSAPTPRSQATPDPYPCSWSSQRPSRASQRRLALF